MKSAYAKILVAMFLVSSALSFVYGYDNDRYERVDIEKWDRHYGVYRTVKRTFRNRHEFERLRRYDKKSVYRRSTSTYRSTYTKHVSQERTKDFHKVYGHRPSRFRHRSSKAKPHRHPKRGWILAYRYDRAAFYDRYGYRYGYFNRYGYFFEGVFYRYDRHYRYRDRIRGRGLFDRHYYAPADRQSYGFCP